MQPRLARVREAAGRLTRVVSALLALFRSGAELQWQAVDLQARCWPACRTKGWTCRCTPPARCRPTPTC
jgi:hypothetical protein